jgi:hypothetical protein
MDGERTGELGILLDLNGFSWIFMEFNGLFNGFSWNLLDFDGF